MARWSAGVHHLILEGFREEFHANIPDKEVIGWEQVNVRSKGNVDCWAYTLGAEAEGRSPNPSISSSSSSSSYSSSL